MLLTLVYDIETTGLNINYHEVIEIGAVLLGPAPYYEELNSFHTYIKPLFPWHASPEAMAVNKINLKSLENMPTKQIAYSAFIQWMKDSIKKEQMQSVVCNKTFDPAFVRNDFNMLGISPSYGFYRCWDVQDLARIVCPALKRFSLEAICNYLKIPYEQSHTAAGDALLTAKAWSRLEWKRTWNEII